MEKEMSAANTAAMIAILAAANLQRVIEAEREYQEDLAYRQKLQKERDDRKNNRDTNN